MALFSEFLSAFNAGLDGKNKGIPIGMPRFEKYLNGLHRGRYYTLFSEGGTGKSSFAWSTFVINPLDYMLRFNAALERDQNLTEEQKAEKRISVKIKLYSLEVVRREVIAKMVCLKIYRDFGIIVSVDYILNRIEGYFVGPTIRFLVQTYAKYFNTLEEKGYLEIIDTPKTPSAIKNDIHQFAASNGKFIKSKNNETRYVPNDPNEIVIILTDTVGNLVVEPVNGKSSVKTTIDAHSANCRFYFRDLLNYTPINISHSNRSMSDPHRGKAGELFPKLSDIKETNMLEQDSSVVMAIFNPMNHILTNKSLSSFMNYDIVKLKERFRCIGILKNRHGMVNTRVGMLFIGENAHFEELPHADSMSISDYTAIFNLKGAQYKKDVELQAIVKLKNPKLYESLRIYLNKKSA